jgi:hypothetical protein
VEDPANIALGTEPQCPTMMESHRQGLSDEPTPAITGGNACCFIEQGARIGNEEQLGMRVTNPIAAGLSQLAERPRKLSLAGCVNPQKQPPMPTGWQQQILIVG